MPTPISAVPDGFHTLTPHLTVKQGAAEYIDFLKRAFGAVELSRSAGPSGRLMNAQVRIGDSVLMLNDHFPEFGSPPIAEGSWPLTLQIYVPDPDTMFAQAASAGCQVMMPLADQFWGDRYGMLTDPFGFRWSIAAHKENLTREELEKRQAAMFGGRSSAQH
jgi:PhnB protein